MQAHATTLGLAKDSLFFCANIKPDICAVIMFVLFHKNVSCIFEYIFTVFHHAEFNFTVSMQRFISYQNEGHVCMAAILLFTTYHRNDHNKSCVFFSDVSSSKFQAVILGGAGVVPS